MVIIKDPRSPYVWFSEDQGKDGDLTLSAVEGYERQREKRGLSQSGRTNP